MGKALELTGQRFGKLVAIERCGEDRHGHAKWLCLCDCGKETIAFGSLLKNGNTQSCGCYRLARISSHNLSKNKLYTEWWGIKTRCFNEKFKHYKDYGGRGITVCDLWKNSFDAFYEYVSRLPHFGEDGFTLNRIDNDGNYEPNNVEWADKITQANNKRNNRLLTHNGKTQTVAKWANETGIMSSVIIKRLNLGWSVDKVLSTPVRQYKTVK